MYQCENTQGTILATKIVNTIMSSAISEILIKLIVQSKSFNEKILKNWKILFLKV